MSNTSTRTGKRAVVPKRFLLLVIIAMLAGASPPAAGLSVPEEERLLEKTSHRDEPLKIKAIKAEKSYVSLGEKFLAGDDWVKSLSFVLENVSGKNITYIWLELKFPGADDGPPLMFPLIYGHAPTPDGDNTGKPPLYIKAGDEVVLGFSAQGYASLKNMLEARKSPGIGHAVFDLRTVLFDDGLMWNRGHFLRRDPVNPVRWVPLGR